LYSPSFEAAPYYQEMLARDAGDSRAHAAMGILLCKQWRWAEAEKHLRAAWQRATANYIRPRDCEAVYYLGAALKAQGNVREARDCFNQALWSPAWQPAAACELAELDLREGLGGKALEHATLALNAGRNNGRARVLAAMAHRALREPKEAARIARELVNADPLSAAGWFQLAQAQRSAGAGDWRAAAAEFVRLAKGQPELVLGVATSLGNAGQWNDVVQLLQSPAFSPGREAAPHLMKRYHLGYALHQLGRARDAADQFAAAAQNIPGLSFPSRWEEEPVLRHAMEAAPLDANAAYLLGCLLFDNRPAEAMRAWEEAQRRNPDFALTHRNLGLAYAQHEKNTAKAIASLEKAVALDREPRLLYELDVQYEAAGAPLERRLAMLASRHADAVQRDDAVTREIVLLTASGQPARALELLRGRRFRNWEGSSQIHTVYVDACLARGRQLAKESKWEAALGEYRAALEYPQNLDVGKARFSARAAEVHYLIGTALEGAGQADAARKEFEAAALHPDRAASESRYYAGLAMKKTGRGEDAKEIFEDLVKAGKERLTRREAADYFAKFGERQSERVRQAEAHYLTALGLAGLEKRSEARAELDKVLELHPAHLGARLN
jgi:tetratricopeptide (TPR) repeat protein